MFRTHEEKVEAFYTHGSKIRGIQDGGFLSFGYWTTETNCYQDAGEALIQRILQVESRNQGGEILNVACGYGAETLRILEHIQPDHIIAIDITGPHIEFAKQHAEALHLSDRVHFEKMDACKLPFAGNRFDYVIGVEGPAHFNTREDFFRRAFDVLKPKGTLLLSDIIVDDTVVEQSPYNRFIGKLCGKHWFMPRANWMSLAQLTRLLRDIGFELGSVESLGEHVYPGFARCNLKWKSIWNAIRIRGLRIGIALTFISWLLGHVHRRKMIDYVIIRATKPPMQ